MKPVAVAGESGEFNAGEMIIDHVSNTSVEHPIIHLPPLFGVDLSVTKHVLMLWIVAVFVFGVITWCTRRYLRQERPVPTGLMNAVEAVVLYIRDSIVLPNVGRKFLNTWTPLILTFFFFILTSNAIGLVPMFDVLGVVDRFILHTSDHSLLNQVLHGGTTATANYNVTAALAIITFLAIMVAGTKAHGFLQHWKNLAPPGLAWPLYFILVPIEIMGMLVKPFALTMRLAANMTGGNGVITWCTRRYLRQERPVPTGLMSAVEAVVLYIRDSIVLPNVGRKFLNTWTPLILTFFFFILTSNAIGLVPMFDVLGVVDRFILHTSDHSLLNQVLHGGTTATANYNVTAALAIITFLAIMVAGTKAHGFLQHWKNLAPPGLAWPLYFILVPIEIMGMLVKPFALTMRLAANMTGGHIAILAILSFVFIFESLFESASVGVAVGLFVSVPLAVGISALEIIVVLVQAYVFTLLTAVFIGMAINVHH